MDDVLSKRCTVCRKSRRRRLITNFIIVLLTMGVVGVATWGLTDSIKDTHHQVDTAWGLVQDASDTVRLFVTGFICVSLPDLDCLMSQVQSIVNIASNTVSLLEKLSPSLRAVAKAASGMGSEQQHMLMTVLCVLAGCKTTASLR